MPARGAAAAAACLAALALAACGGGPAPAPTAGAGALQDVTIGVGAPATELLLPYYAQKYGFFKEYGLSASIVSLSGTQLFEAMAGGTVPLGSFGAPQAEMGDAQGAKLEYLATWVDSSTLQLVVSPGIRSAAGLRGKTVGVTAAGSTTATLTQAALASAGLPKTAYKEVPLGTAQQVQDAFVTGQVDAIMASPPLLGQILAQRPGSRVLVDLSTAPGWAGRWPDAGVVAYMPWVEAHKTVAVKVIAALAAAAKSFTTHEAQAETVIGQQTHVTGKAELASAWLAVRPLFTTALTPSAAAEAHVFQVLQAAGTSLGTLRPADVIDTGLVPLAGAQSAAGP